MTVSYRAPVAKNITSSSIFHGAMDNFDHEENTLSGIEGSHDTILMLFQKNETIDNTENISHRSEDIATMSTRKSTLNHTVDCQKLIRKSKFSNRGTIAAEFRPTKPPDFDAIVQKSKIRYEIWCILRYLSHKSEDIHIRFLLLTAFYKTISL